MGVEDVYVYIYHEFLRMFTYNLLNELNKPFMPIGKYSMHGASGSG